MSPVVDADIAVDPDAPRATGYGREVHEYTPEAPFRQRIVFARTIRPGICETNGDFEQRMDILAGTLISRYKARRVRTENVRQDGAIVECLVTVEYDPRPMPVADDPRPAGGRSPGPRGGR